MNALPWLILLLPLFSAVLITCFFLRDREIAARLSIGAVALGFLLTIFYVAVSGWQPARDELAWTWLEAGNLRVDFGIKLDPLSLMMLLIVTGVGAAIHVYSHGYMHEDRSLPRYFASLSFFTFAMLGIVLSNNFLQLFIFWELVGVSSYLLIGFWYDRPAAADASKKAFLLNRLGDFGFLLGILVVWSAFGTLNFGLIESELAANPAALAMLGTLGGLLIFCGAAGKSAQFPLHVWLPDAMEGPTPVSAFIHAATMVAAGVYMLCRVFVMLNAPALEVIAYVGAFTALFAAVIAVQQNDIKRILAYSTLSQLGYMVMAVGAGGPASAMYHLSTHAFFKALLFLGAGSVIVALHHEQNIWKMGGLKSRMPVTFWTFLLATLALCGVPPFSGFYSKDAVLLEAWTRNAPLFAVGLITAVLTAFYMFRLVFVVFYGPARSENSARAHDTPKVMTVPLMVLAVPSVLAGFWGIEAIYALHFGLEPVHAPGFFGQFFEPFIHAPGVAFLSLFAVVLGFFAALGLYYGKERDPLPEALGGLGRAMRRRFYLDEIYEGLNNLTHEALAKAADGVDRWIIAGLLVRGTHGTTELVGRALRLVQTGNLQTYAFLLVAGAAVLIYFVLR